MKNSKSKSAVKENVNVEATVEAPKVNIVKQIPMKKASPGRPVNKNSVRQIRLADIAERKENGTFGRTGRPINPNSVNQAKVRATAERVANGEVITRGRPIDKTSARQVFLDDIAERKANGTYKLGRPAGTKNKVVEIVEEADMIEMSEQTVD